MKEENNLRVSKIRIVAILILSLVVVVTGAFYVSMTLRDNDIGGTVLGILAVIIILFFALIVFIRGNRDIKKGLPIQDERSKKVLDKASSRAFYISFYVLLGVGFFSNGVINFRDVSQATSISIGLMAVLFVIFWIYYSRKEF